MSSQNRSLGRTIWNLLLALLNATLILIALCLWLAWQISTEISSLTATFAQNLIEVEPLREEVRGLREDVANLKSDLAALQTQSGELRTASLTRIEEKVEIVEARVSSTADSLGAILDEPMILIDYTVESSAEALKLGIADLRGCTLPEA